MYSSSVTWGGPRPRRIHRVSDDTGFKIPIGPPDYLRAALRERLGYILENRDCLPGYSQRALASIEERFLWSSIADKISRQYEIVLKSRGTPVDEARDRGLDDGPAPGENVGDP